jgi:general secretion pathway protein A
MPFTREISVKDHFEIEPSRHALEALLQTIEQCESGVLIAPAGTGKTQLLRALVARLPEARYRSHYVKVTGLSKRDMCREISMATGVEPAGSFPSLIRRLQERFLQTLDTDALRPVLILDDAHEIRIDVIGMIRLLTNYDMDSRLVLSVILAGQPPLRRLLQHEQLDDVAKRMAHYATLRPLSRKETHNYTKHRCTVAGAKTLPLDAKALDAIYEIGRGNLRASDRLALKTLEVAHEQNADVADQNHTVEARKRLWP